MKEYTGLQTYVNALSVEDLRLQAHAMIGDAHSYEDICGMFDVLIDRLEEATLQYDQAIVALKQAKKALKKTLKTLAKPKDVEHKPEDCRNFTVNAYLKCGGCLATKEIDPCKGAKYKNWKPKEEAK